MVHKNGQCSIAEHESMLACVMFLLGNESACLRNLFLCVSCCILLILPQNEGAYRELTAALNDTVIHIDIAMT